MRRRTVPRTVRRHGNGHRNRHRPVDLVDARRLAVDRLGRAAVRCRCRQPPFLNQLSTVDIAGRAIEVRRRAYADSAAEFLSLAVRLTRPGGRVGLVLPLSMLSTRDVAAIRDDVSRRAALRWMWWSPTLMFDASVRVWAGVWEVGGDAGRGAPRVRAAVRSAAGDRDAGAMGGTDRRHGRDAARRPRARRHRLVHRRLPRSVLRPRRRGQRHAATGHR